mmetsp:Transcript_7640/g.17861  ORF Transcript_7640/g.17861 Transcript_7640/m.17861 type:complete len:230 (+) Transcript_7640:2407-3096(+)
MGSGIWINTGRSLNLAGSRSLSDSLWQLDPERCLGPGICRACERVRAMGYDTVQYVNGHSFRLFDCRAADSSGGRHLWTHACPPPHVELLQGVPRRRYAPALESLRVGESRACVCDSSFAFLNCFGRRGTDPSPHPPPPPALPKATWTRHAKNCWNQNGARELGTDGEVLDVKACQDACVRYTPEQCTGVVVDGNRYPGGKIMCYLRAGIQLDACTDSSDYSTYTRSNE